MKYTKEFENYWEKAEGSNYRTVDREVIKSIAFLAWKSGINKTKRDYCLIKIREERETGRKLIQEMREKNA